MPENPEDGFRVRPVASCLQRFRGGLAFKAHVRVQEEMAENPEDGFRVRRFTLSPPPPVNRLSGQAGETTGYETFEIK